MKVKTEKCVFCNGTGHIASSSTIPKTCDKCEGKGTIQVVEFENKPINNN